MSIVEDIKKYWGIFKFLDSKLFNTKREKKTIKLKKNSQINIKLK